MVLLRSREVEPPKAKPKTPVANRASLDAVGSRSGDPSASGKPSEGSQAAVPADTVAPSLHSAGSTISEPRALASHVRRVTRGANRGFKPIPGEVSGLVAADFTTNDPPPNSVTEPAIGSQPREGQEQLSRDGQSPSRSTSNGQPKRKCADSNNIRSAAVPPVVVDNGGDTCDINPAFQPRKLRKLSVKTYAHTENLWMGNTLEGIQIAEETNNKALGLLKDGNRMLEDMSFDSNQIIELLLKQEDTLAAVKDYILCCGAKETRITKRWERSE